MTAITTLKKTSASAWFALFWLAVLFLALRWNNYAAPLDRDEGEYAYAAQLLVQGIPPYDHAFIQKPPAVFYSYALSSLFLPDAFWSPRILADLFVALATLLLGFVARLEFGEGYALPAMSLATPMILLPGLELAGANVEIFMLLPMMATVAIYCFSRKNGNKNSHWFAAGFLVGVTLLYKYTAMPVLAFVFIAWLFELWQQGGKAKSIFCALTCSVAGGALAGVLGLGYFLLHDGGKTFWECTVAFNRYYAGTDNFSLGYFWSRCEDFFGNWWILFLIPWAILLQPRPRLWFWLGIFVCAIVSANGSCYGHYYAIMMPFWALLCAVGLRNLALRLGRERAGLATGLITILVVALVLRPDMRWMVCSGREFAQEKMQAYPFFEAQLLANEVIQRSSPNDFVYVAGSEPEIYNYAQRFSSTRFITTYALMIPTPLASHYQDEASHDLQSRPPKLIVFAQSGAGWLRQAATPPEFQNFIGGFLHQNYGLVGGYVKASQQESYWTTNLNLAEFRSASLLLYERRNPLGQ
jgi:hypothetical protein